MIEGEEQRSRQARLAERIDEPDVHAEALNDRKITSIDTLVTEVNEAVGFHTHEMDMFKGFVIKLALARHEIARKLETMPIKDIDPDFVINSTIARRQADQHLRDEIIRLGETTVADSDDPSLAHRFRLRNIEDAPDEPQLVVEHCVDMTNAEIEKILCRQDKFFEDYSYGTRMQRIGEYWRTHDTYIVVDSTEVGSVDIPSVIDSVDQHINQSVELKGAIEDAVWGGDVILARSIDEELDVLTSMSSTLHDSYTGPTDISSVRRRPRTVKVPIQTANGVRSVRPAQRRKYVAAERSRQEHVSDSTDQYEKEPRTLSGRILLLGKKAAEQVVEVFHRAA